jgi:transcriptional regulator of heat shock response
MDITDRQEQLLKAIINEFINSAEAVGSLTLQTKHNLNVSTATIRNEMAELAKLGFLEKPHTSSGRVPTSSGFKHFLKDISDDLEDIKEEDAAKMHEVLFQNRFDLDSLIDTALNYLVQETGLVGFAVVGNRIYHAGVARMPSIPDFRQAQDLCNLLELLEDHVKLRETLEQHSAKSHVRILFGDDTHIPNYINMVLIYSLIRVYRDQMAYIGVIGPQRLNYRRAIPMVDLIANNIEEMIRGW